MRNISAAVLLLLLASAASASDDASADRFLDFLQEDSSNGGEGRVDFLDYEEDGDGRLLFTSTSTVANTIRS